MLSPELSKSINPSQHIWKSEGTEWTHTRDAVTQAAQHDGRRGLYKESQRCEKNLWNKSCDLYSLCGKRGTKAEWSWRRKATTQLLCHKLDQVTGMKGRRFSALGGKTRRWRRICKRKWRACLSSCLNMQDSKVNNWVCPADAGGPQGGKKQVKNREGSKTHRKTVPGYYVRISDCL